MIKWTDVVEGTQELEKVLESVDLQMTPRQFVILNEIVRTYTESTRCDPRVLEEMNAFEFKFVKKQ